MLQLLPDALLQNTVVAVYVSSFLRSLAGADIIVDLGNLLQRKTLAEMYYHGGVEQRLLDMLMQSEKVLHVKILLYLCYTFLVREFTVFLDKNRSENNPGRICPATGFYAHVTQIEFLNLLSGHDPGKLHSTVFRIQRSAERQIEILQRMQVIIRAVIHPHTTNPGLFAHISLFCLDLLYHGSRENGTVFSHYLAFSLFFLTHSGFFRKLYIVVCTLSRTIYSVEV